MKNRGLNDLPADNRLLLSLDTIRQPDIYLERLCEVARRDQWHGDELDWRPINFQGAPQSLRQQVADMFAQLHYGEVAAFVGAAKFAQSSPILSERLFSRAHVADEARHVGWFSQLMEKLHCETKVEDSVAHLVDDILHTEQGPEFVLGLHLFIEGMAHSFFLEGAKAFSEDNWLKNCSRTYRSARTVFGEWLPQYLGKDEGRHIAFGIYYLKKQIAEMTTQQRDRLETKTQHWITLFKKVLVDPKLTVVSGLDGPAMQERCIDELNRLLDKVGLHSRIIDIAPC